MGIGVSIFLMAAGAILAWGLNIDSDESGIANIDTIGIILLIVGAIGLLLSLLFWSSFSPWGHRGDNTTTVVRDREREVL